MISHNEQIQRNDTKSNHIHLTLDTCKYKNDYLSKKKKKKSALIFSADWKKKVITFINILFNNFSAWITKICLSE